MAILEVVEYPAEVLETKSPDVTKYDNELKQFVKNMHETMDSANGIGLAANQVGELRRIFVIHIPYDQERYDEGENPKQPWHDKRFTFINPVITKKAGKISWQEGCLSFPEIYDFVDRSAEVWVDAYDENGKKFSLHADGLFSVCIQHELDHIDGIVFISRMSRLKSAMIKKKLARKGIQSS